LRTDALDHAKNKQEEHMRLKYWLSCAGGLMALAFLATPAQAAPVGGVVDLGPVAAEASDVQNVRWRRCWRHRGHWHCRRRHVHYYPYYYGAPYAFGPSFSIHIGRRHHHRHHRRHRHW
jgi:hypothetical protein